MTDSSSENALQAITFETPAKRGMGLLEKKLKDWISKNPSIEIVSTSFGGFGEKIGYVVLYRPQASSQNVRQELSPEMHSDYKKMVEESAARYDERLDSPASANLHEEPENNEDEFFEPRIRRPSLNSTALFGNSGGYDPFSDDS